MENKILSFGARQDSSGTPRRITPDMVRSRTVELAISAGRHPLEIRQSDYERAKRELTGETDDHRQLGAIHPEWFA